MPVQKNTKDLTISKSNDLIQKGVYNLSANGFKILGFFISNIKPKQVDYIFSVADIRKALNMTKCGRNNQIIKNSIGNLCKCYFYFINGNATESTAWFRYIKVDDNEVQIKFNSYAMPYLTELREKYTKYRLSVMIKLKSKYALRLYEIFKSWENIAVYNAEINYLKRQLDAERYENYNTFNKKVLEIAVKDINENSDIYIDYVAVKEGRAVKFVQFHILNKYSEEYKHCV